MEKTKITVEVVVDAALAKVWDCWTSPDHVTKWNAASDDWHTPRATNDVKVGGSFNYRMEARNKSAGFDYWGTYSLVSPREHLHFLLGDGRHVDVRFLPEGSGVRVVEEFETETTNSAALQRTGWQAILDNFKRHVEAA
jgi:uncharacterized protein YndB with AHSA1/START domain